MLASYHNHTKWSDGKGTIAEMVDAAQRLGVGELGISDHLVLPSAGRPWAMPEARLGEYFAEIRAHAGIPGLAVRVGVEVDWFGHNADLIARTLEGHELDFLVGSVHEVGDFVIDGSPAVWRRLDGDARDDVFRRYWRSVADMARSGMFDIVGHVDLPKKFGFMPSCDLSTEITAALDAIAEADLVVELNTAGWSKPCNDAYPTLDILRACRERGIVATLSADAHDPSHLVRDFDAGIDRLKAAGYTELARFAGRERRMEPIDEAV